MQVPCVDAPHTAIRPKKKRRVVCESDPPSNIGRLPNENDVWTRKKASVSAPGFLGQTSYFDAFTDTRNGLLDEIPYLAGHDNFPVDLKRINLGARVLTLLENLPFYRDVITARYKIWTGWSLGWPVTNMVFTAAENMWNSLETKDMDTNQRAFFLSKRLFETHNRALEVHSSMTWEEFQTAAAGRWELIGLLFTLTGLATDWVPHSDRIFMRQNTMDASSLAITATAVGDICLQFCDSTGIVNDIVGWLLLHQTTLLAIVYGESDFRPWRKLGELSTTLFALGLHQDSSGKAPFFLSEMRKRTMVAAYSMDKVLATFLGRPPLISWRYCDIQMPLDLSVEEIFADSVIRDAAIARLDENNGWNLESSLVKGTWPRIALITNILREKVLELSLSWQLENLSQRVEELSRESRELRKAMPDFLRWKPDIDMAAVPRVEYDLLFEVHIEFLYNEFLLYRTLGKRTQTQPEAIIDIAREILKALVTMISEKTRSGQPIKSMGFSVCLPGLPSAGVLCAELLRRSRPTVISSLLEFPRSEIIQNLTLFAAYLDGIIKPHNPNYRVAQQGQKAIRHVLDQVLSIDGPSSIVEDSGTNDKFIDDASLRDGVNFDDHDLFLGWLDGNMQHMSDSWLSWVNFT
ncbi:Transcription factor, fungi [Penicillium expansum]|uniref:Transcription factor, fungi n=1 Tax=Penicillium expansum TaxID=27334 RepID=A0A0A2K6B7_PENEN|nr:Transcription factor, fungi [Penicillium expansum]KGO40681.1 Transcription factor, fungi [Penicillium expansum]KGO63379.1 Transcription factor, fungi [Penicillium expansum]KGO70776.1 Transcription factor, fungi [Penicillium expansum]